MSHVDLSPLVKTIERRTQLARLLKYNEDQPRDANGRWGSGSTTNKSDRISASRIPRAEPGALTVKQRAVETKFAKQIAASPKDAEALYAKLADTAGGKILNTDTVRELSAEYRNDRSSLSPAVHEPASHFTKMMYANRLAEAPVSNTVMFTSGGAGAGKSSGIKGVPAAQAMQDRADVVYDTNMNKFSSAKEKIDQALATGRDVQIAYVARDPVEALTHGALPRAMGSGGGRTVPLSEHIKTHVGAATTIKQIAEHYADNPNVQIHYIDNTKGKGGATLSDKTLPDKLNFENLSERLHSALKAEHEAGRISTRVYEGTKGQTDTPH